MDLKLRLADALDAHIREQQRQARKAENKYQPGLPNWAEYHNRKAAEYERLAERLAMARIIEGDER